MKTPSHVLPLAIAQFRKDWPVMAFRIQAMRAKAAQRGPARGDTAPAEGVPALATPPSNTGVNELMQVARGSAQ